MPIEFTKQQKTVIEHDQTRHGVVRAGPGTGKSATVVALAQRLRSECPEVRIGFLTFTRAATSELAKKISSTEGMGIKPSTIHSFAASILMQNQDALPVTLPLRIPSDYEAKKFIYTYIGKAIGKRSSRVEKLVRAKASMWETLAEDFTLDDITPEEKAKFVSAFNQASRIFGFTLLDQLPDLLRRLINEHVDVKGLEFDFIIIDEYQDLNRCEIELFKLLDSKGIKILAVGDGDQSIYSFRKAHPAGIGDFESYFSDAASYELSICHRCPANLLGWAQHVIQGDLTRASRALPESKSELDAEIKLLHFAGDVGEAKGVASIIQSFVNKGIYLDDILVLTRSDDKQKFTKRIKEELENAEIAVFDSRSTKQLLEVKDVRLLFAYLRLLDNEKDSLAWMTILRETNGIGPTTIDPILEYAEAQNRSFGESLLMKESELLGSRAPFREVRENLQKAKNEFDQHHGADSIKWGDWIVNTIVPLLELNLTPEVTELLTQVDSRIEVNDPSLNYFISQIVPISKDIANEQQNGVRFMTMQGAKGLTARVTIVVGVDDDLIPSPRNDDHNEERRLLYVAMTRSQETLIMTWANRRRGPQARSGNANSERRSHTNFLSDGPVHSEDGAQYVRNLSAQSNQNRPREEIHSK